jgi:hypothetical protein
MARPASFGSSQKNGVRDNRIVLSKLFAVHREHAARSIIKNTDKIDIALGLFDPCIELFAVIADRNKLDEGLLTKEDQSAN